MTMGSTSRASEVLRIVVFAAIAGSLPVQIAVAWADDSQAEPAAVVAEEPATDQKVATDLSTPVVEDEAADSLVLDTATVPTVEEQVAASDVASAMELAETPAAGEDFDSDPWEPFNEKMFQFNREVVDRYILRPVATAWDFLLPDPVQRGLHNAFDNLAVVRRVVNNALQAKFAGSAKELARFTINSTIGLVGFFDVAKDGFGIEESDEDAGQTFGVWGMGPGPYLILPFLPPLTVRDAFGYALDAVMTPYTYFIPWDASIGMHATDIVNERSLNLDRFERVAKAQSICTAQSAMAICSGALRRSANSEPLVLAHFIAAGLG